MLFIVLFDSRYRYTQWIGHGEVQGLWMKYTDWIFLTWSTYMSGAMETYSINFTPQEFWSCGSNVLKRSEY